MNLNDAEQKLFELLTPGKEVPLDDIHHELGGNRKAIIVRLKYLAAKVSPSGWIIERVSEIGRGKKAIYKMSKKF